MVNGWVGGARGEMQLSFKVAMFFFQEEMMEDKIRKLKEKLMSARDFSADGRLQMQEVSSAFL